MPTARDRTVAKPPIAEVQTETVPDQRLREALRDEAVRADLDSLAYAKDQVLGDWLPEASEA